MTERTIERAAIVPFSAEQMFALVNDIDTYPEFLPWCQAATVQSRSDTEVVASLQLGAGALHSQFTTRNELKSPEQMIMRLVDGPFKSLEGIWSFKQVGEQGCQVSFSAVFQFSSAAKDALFGVVFEKICSEMIEAFMERAQDVYGE